MKKVLLSALLALTALLVIPVSASAAAAQTNVTGVVTNAGNPVAGADVTVVCNNHSQQDTTDASGAYLVIYTATECPNGAKATAVATKAGLGGVNSGNANAQNTKLNIAIVNVSLPEFGLITGAGTLALAGGAFFVIRRKQVGQN